MSARNEGKQSWEFKTALIGDLSLELKIPQDPTLITKEGKVDLPAGRIRTKDGVHITESIDLPIADISNLITTVFTHVAVGKPITDGLDRVTVHAQLMEAMKIINYNGATQLIKVTQDAGQFEFAGNLVTFQRQTSGITVTTSYNTELLSTKDGGVRNGTWTLLSSDISTVRPAVEEYAAYAAAYAGEEGEPDTDKE